MQTFLNLQDRESVADFILNAMDYLPAKERKPFEQITERVQAGEPVAKEELLDSARSIADATWASKHALDRFLKSIGAELEWEAVLQNVRPATALLLKRLRKNAGTPDLASTLAHPDASYAIHSDQEIEITMVDDEVRVDLFETHKEALEPMIEEAQTELDAIKKRLKKIRDQALEMKGAAQDTLLSRLNAIEDDVFFGDEAPSLEKLDTELHFDREEAANPSEA